MRTRWINCARLSLRFSGFTADQFVHLRECGGQIDAFFAGLRQELAHARVKRDGFVEQAELEALGMKKAAREQAPAEIADQQATVDQEICKALASIDKMQEAVKAEL